MKKVLLVLVMLACLSAVANAFTVNDVSYVMPSSFALDIIYSGDLSNCAIYDGTKEGGELVDQYGNLMYRERYGCYSWNGFCKCALRDVVYDRNTFADSPRNEDNGGDTDYNDKGCSPRYAPVCAINGVTYKDDCVMEDAKAMLDHVGLCTPDAPIKDLTWWDKLIAWIKNLLGFD